MRFIAEHYPLWSRLPFTSATVAFGVAAILFWMIIYLLSPSWRQLSRVSLRAYWQAVRRVFGLA